MRTSIVVGVGAVVIAASALTGQAVASSPGHQRGGTFTVVERALTDTTADTGPAGDSLGDVLAFANPIFDRRNSHQLGTDNGSCIRTAVGVSYECSWTTSLRGGSIVVSGPFLDAGDSTLAVTGGTGAYRGASGQMRLHPRDAAGSSYDFTFSLSRSDRS
ncbi:MAG: allene oxide cyclase family protein [Nocardioidaceae bacterium]